jgi:hypothetical protein
MVFAWMVFEGKHLKSSDPFRPTEFLDSMLTGGFPKYFPVKIQIASLDVEVFYPTFCCFLFPKFVPDASWLASAKTFCVRQSIRLKERPQKVIRDLMLLEKWAKALGCRSVGSLDMTHQQVKMV